MTGTTRWVRDRWVDLCSRLVPPLPEELETGASYVWLCRVDGVTFGVGTVVEADAWVDPAHLPGEALLQVYSYAVVRDDAGRLRNVPRRLVLWRAEDHAAVRRATAVLGLPLAPHSVRGGPTWRFGAVRLSLRDLLDLDRLLVLR